MPEPPFAPSLAAYDDSYRLMFERSPLPMWVFDVETLAFLIVNAAAVEVYGYSSTEFLDLTLTALVPPDRIPDWEQIQRGPLDEVRRFSNIQHLTKSGRRIDVEITSNPLMVNGRAVRLVIAQDVTEKKRLEAIVRESEQYYRALADAMPQIVWSTAPDGSVTYFNQRWYDYTQLTAEQSLGWGWQQAIHPDDSAGIVEHWTAALRTLEPFEIEGRYYDARSASYRWQLIRATPMRDASGQILQWFGTSTDIDDQKQAAHAIEQTEQRYRFISQITSDAIWDWDLLTDHVIWNEGVHKLFGYSTAQANTSGEWWIAHIHPDDRARIVASIDLVLGGEAEFWDGEYRFARHDGNYAIVHDRGHVFRSAQGQAVRMVGAMLDRTEQYYAEAALRTSEQRYRTLVRHFPNGSVALFDHEMRYIVADGSALSHHQRTTQNFIGKTLREAVSPERAALLEPLYRAALRGEAQVEELTFDQHVYLSHIVPVRSDDGTILGGMAMSQEITQLKQAQDQIRQLNAELEQRVSERTAQLSAANRELEAFSYSVSHDLRAPLRSIDGFSQVLLEDYGDQLDEQARSYLQRVRNATHRMAQLINDLLKLSRVTRAELNYLPIDLTALAHMIANDLHSRDPQRAVSFVIADGLSIEGDPVLIRILLENLLGNAWKFSSKHSVARIEVGSTMLDHQRAFWIRDDGAGFDMAYQHKLFGAFQRLHSINEFDGTGIGLATVERIVQRHGGRVWATGEVEHGATFWFTLRS